MAEPGMKIQVTGPILVETVRVWKDVGIEHGRAYGRGDDASGRDRRRMIAARGDHAVLLGDPLNEGRDRVEAERFPNDGIKRSDFICLRRGDRLGGDLGTQKNLLGRVVDCL